MKDKFGRELSVGDYVLYPGNNTAITRFKDKARRSDGVYPPRTKMVMRVGRLTEIEENHVYVLGCDDVSESGVIYPAKKDSHFRNLAALIRIPPEFLPAEYREVFGV